MPYELIMVQEIQKNLLENEVIRDNLYAYEKNRNVRRACIYR